MKVYRFEADQSKLDPSFEAYKLSSSGEHVPLLSEIPLVKPAHTHCGVLDTSGELQPLAYKLQMNSLFQNPYSPYEAYLFDERHALWRVEIAEEEILEQVIAGQDEWIHDGAVPSLGFLSKELVLVIRGKGRELELLSTRGRLISTFSLNPAIACPPELDLSSCDFVRIADCKQNGDKIQIAITQIAKAGRATRFLLHWCTLDLKSCVLQTLQTFESCSRPVIVRLDQSGIIIGSQREFRIPGVEVTVAETAPIAIKWEQDEENVFISFKAGPDTKVQIEPAIDRVVVIVDGVTLIQEEPCSPISAVDSTWSKTEQSYLITLSKSDRAIWPYLWSSQKTEAQIDDQYSEPDSLYAISLLKYGLDGRPIWKTSTADYIGPYPDIPLKLAFAVGDDALAYSITDDGCQHLVTYDAIAFVQAGKQDRRYVVFIEGATIIVESSGHVFIYERPVDRTSQFARQFLVDLDSHEAIIGWATIGRNRFIVLTKSTCRVIVLPF
ncbi:hypothetical protein PSACC_00960 [Paramicrosporidium saccamoebae]|uniref:NudC domain-containing protein 1 n=1 Tax=Paramicrosporidium saccamoebae TaxID=1246581 RepID=A0A2H9TNB4_9FUNG|nr:hypothetical protein PSACC_00960 [Paramicrosporidium saccamoebae]